MQGVSPWDVVTFVRHDMIRAVFLWEGVPLDASIVEEWFAGWVADDVCNEWTAITVAIMAFIKRLHGRVIRGSPMSANISTQLTLIYEYHDAIPADDNASYAEDDLSEFGEFWSCEEEEGGGADVEHDHGIGAFGSSSSGHGSSGKDASQGDSGSEESYESESSSGGSYEGDSGREESYEGDSGSEGSCEYESRSRGQDTDDGETGSEGSLADESSSDASGDGEASSDNLSSGQGKNGDEKVRFVRVGREADAADSVLDGLTRKEGSALADIWAEADSRAYAAHAASHTGLGGFYH